MPSSDTWHCFHAVAPPGTRWLDPASRCAETAEECSEIRSAFAGRAMNLGPVTPEARPDDAHEAAHAPVDGGALGNLCDVGPGTCWHGPSRVERPELSTCEPARQVFCTPHRHEGEERGPVRWGFLCHATRDDCELERKSWVLHRVLLPCEQAP